MLCLADEAGGVPPPPGDLWSLMLGSTCFAQAHS